MLTFLSFSVSKENIEHEVTDCTFCDCKVKWSVSLAEFLSFLENITVEKTEDVKRIDIDRTDPCLMNALFYVNIDQGIHKGKSKVAGKLCGFSFYINIFVERKPPFSEECEHSIPKLLFLFWFQPICDMYLLSKAFPLPAICARALQFNYKAM